MKLNLSIIKKFFADISSPSQLSPFWLTLLFGFPLIFFIAESPQNPDGAEFVTVALQGGVPHPPGFALLCWLNRLLLFLLPGFPKVFILSSVSLLFHFLGTWIFSLNFHSIGARGKTLLAAILLYLYFPVVCGLGLQPEKYASYLFLLHLFIYSGIRILRELPLPIKATSKDYFPYALLGISQGLSLPHHDASYVLIPTTLMVIFFMVRHKSSRESLICSTLLVLLPAIILSLLLYSSLPYLRGSSPWVDWGNLQGPFDVWKYLTHKNYGHIVDLTEISLWQRMNGDVLSLLSLHLKDVFSYTHFFLIPLGGWQLWQKRRNIFYFIFCILLGMLFICCLIKMNISIEELGYMERYVVLPLPALFLIYASGVLGLADFLQKAWPKISLFATLAFGFYSIFYLQNCYEINGKMNNGFYDLYRKLISQELPPKVFFLSADDWSLLAGIPIESPTDGGNKKAETLIFPFTNFFPIDWYRFHVAPRMDKRISVLYQILDKRMHWTFLDLTQEAYNQSFSLATTIYDDLKPLGEKVERRGLVWVAGRELETAGGKQRKNATLRICQSLQQADLPFPVPMKGNFYNKVILRNIGFVFWDISKVFYNENNLIMAKKAARLADSLRPGIVPEVWKHLCQDFQKDFPG